MAGIRKRLGTLLGPEGRPGPKGLPGVNAVPADEAVATYVTTSGTSTHQALTETTAASITDQTSPVHAAVVEAVGGVTPDGVITSTNILRIIASDDPDTPLTDGDLLLVYEAAFSHFEDFADDLTGWTPQWNGPDTWATQDEAAYLPSATDVRRLLTLDAAADSLTDVDVITKIKANPIPATVGAGLAARATGGPGTETAYVMGITEKGLVFAKYINGTGTISAHIDLNLTPETWYWIRYRVTGDRIQGRIWADGTAEPTTWMINTTDADLPGPGMVGIASTRGGPQWWDVVSIASGGDTAPKEAP